MFNPYKSLRQRFKGSDTLPSRALSTLLLPLDTLHLGASLLFSSDTHWKTKLKALAALAYILSPLDLIPEFFLGVFGLAEDSALAFIMLHSIISSAEEAALVRHWAGDATGLERLRKLLPYASRVLSFRSILKGRSKGK